MAENTEDSTDVPEDKGLPEGVTKADLDSGQSREGAPKAPEVSNAPPEDLDKKAKEAEALKIEADAKTKAEAEAAAEKAKQEQEKKDQETDDVLAEFPVYGDESADAAVGILKEAGVTPAEADKYFRAAVESNDLSKIDVAGLTEKIGKDKAAHVMLAVKDFYARQLQSTQESVDAVYKELGGQENWEKVRDWAAKKSAGDKDFAKQKENLNQMIDLNKTAAAIAARELKSLYEKDPGNKSLTSKMVHGDKSASSSDTGGEPISRADYLAKVKEAHAKRDMDEVKRLDAQRLATKQREAKA